MEADDERRALLHKHLESELASAKFRRRLACAAILVAEALERIAYYGISGNLVLFLNMNPLGWSSYNAVNALAVFSATSYIMALLGGCLGDTIGNFKTIAIAFLIYLCGYAIFPFIYPFPVGIATQTYHNADELYCFLCPRSSSISSNSSSCNWMHSVEPAKGGPELCAWSVYTALIIMAIGNGMVKANMAPFGAIQIRQEGPEAMRVFFNWYYWTVNVGAFISLTVVAFVQQEINFCVGYIIPASCLALAAIVFLSAGCIYQHKRPSGSALINVFRVLKEAISINCCNSRKDDMSNISDSVERPPSCLDVAKVQYGGNFHESLVNDVKCLGNILVVFVALVPYWLVYFQMESTFLFQGLHMRLGPTNISGTFHFQIPAASLSLLDVIFVILLIPLLDRIIFPKLDRSGYSLSKMNRISLGMLFAVFSVAVSGGVETVRLQIFNSGGNFSQEIAGTSYNASDMSIFWQTPQYALVGISEAFASVAGLEFACSQAPYSMQSVVVGLFWLFSGIGSFLGTASIYWFQGTWFQPGDHGTINCKDCHLDYYFYVLAGFQFLALIVFVILTRKHNLLRPTRCTATTNRRGSSTIYRNSLQSSSAGHLSTE